MRTLHTGLPFLGIIQAAILVVGVTYRVSKGIYMRFSIFVEKQTGFQYYRGIKDRVCSPRGVRHGFYREVGPGKQFWSIGRSVFDQIITL